MNTNNVQLEDAQTTKLMNKKGRIQKEKLKKENALKKNFKK